MLRRMGRKLLFAFVIGALAACGESTLAPLPLQITVEANGTTAAPGDTINFIVTAQGGTLCSGWTSTTATAAWTNTGRPVHARRA